ncbi:MAG: helix-turn-helix transcriptional regulator [Lachnospiraceae bacterium]|nr:helix-turn-helix transcriptional regulator [Lachnospiraceae bacterium]
MNVNEQFYKRISQTIKRYRKLNNLTQFQLAEMLSIDTNYYGQLERAERPFTLDNLIHTCQILDVNVSNLIDPCIFEDNDETVKKRTDLLIEIMQDLEELSLHQLRLLSRYVSEVLIYSED